MKYFILRVNDDGDIVGEPSELITCKYCEWWSKDKLYHCGLGKGYKFTNDYCSEADRRIEKEDE